MKIGLLVQYREPELAVLKRIGMKSCQLIVPPHSPLNPATASDDDIAKAVDWFKENDIEVSALGDYRNNLDPNPAERKTSIEHMERLITLATKMGVGCIGTFAGREPEKSVEDNIPAFKEVWGPLAEKAEAAGVKFGFENCPMFQGHPYRGVNIAYAPRAWDAMFTEVPSDAIGIEYDPSHLICFMMDPVGIIKKYGSKIVHVHAKDAEVNWDYVREHGIMEGPSSRHRTPGMGECNWNAIISALVETGYNGNLDIEGFHDPVYSGDREEEGMMLGFKHLLAVIGEQI